MFNTSTLNPQPQTPNPKPQTLNPKPDTPNPKPETRHHWRAQTPRWCPSEREFSLRTYYSESI